MDNNLRNREFLGQGLAFPLQIDPRGEIDLAIGHQEIDQSIYLILETMPGERVMRPEFGCRIHELVFAPFNSETEGLMIYYIEQALTQWEPRITLSGITVSQDAVQDGAVLIEISYRVKETHDQRSIVHPFYIMAEEEVL